MVVKVDSQTIVDDNIESLTFTRAFEYGTHIVEVTAYSIDGRSKTEYFETKVNFASGKASIDFLEYSQLLYISKSKPNLATFKVALYNTTTYGTLSLYKYRKGTTDKVLLGSTTDKTLEVEFEYFEQLGTTGLSDVTWVLSAEYDGNGEPAVTTKDVIVRVDRNILKFYDGIVSGMYFAIGDTREYREGSYITEVFKSGDFTASYKVDGANVDPYFVVINFLCYADDGSQFLYKHYIDPYEGYSEEITLDHYKFGLYKMIKVTAEAWYYDRNNTHFVSGDIWLYRDK